MAQTWPVTLLTDAPAPILVSVPPSDRLTIAVTHTDGRVTRWAADEPAAENTPGQLTFASSIPGGHKDCTFTLPRSLNPALYSDESLFDDVRVLGPGGTVVWQGRVTQLPRAQDDTASLQVQCVGYAASMLDDQSFREIYLDRDLGRWGAPSTGRQTALYTGNYRPQSLERAADGGLRGRVTGPWDATAKPIAEGWYDSSGVPIGSVYYSLYQTAGINASSDANWFAEIRLATDADGTVYNGTGDIATANGPTTVAATVNASTTTRTRAIILSYYDAATTANGAFDLFWRVLKVYGGHGLTLRGTEPDAGFYASDIVADVIARCCPLAQSTDIDDTSYIVPQAAFLEPTTAEDVVSRMNAFHQWRWGWWGRSFFFKSRASDIVWEARLSDGARPAFEGDDAAQVINGVVVTYTDEFGLSKVAGPTGYATADVTSDSLLDESDGNPCNRAGLKRWAKLTLTAPTNSTGAVQIGAAYLTERNLPSRRGTITLAGWVRHPTAGLLPVSRVRAGDWIKITDLPGDVEREIISATYNHESRTVTLEVGGQVARLDAILERFGAEIGLL